METEDKPRFLESLRSPISGLSAVQVESAAQSRDLVQEVRELLLERPVTVIPLIAAAGQERLLLDTARAAVAVWDAGQGVLLLCDETTGEPSARFWQAMNMLREHWGALDAHVVFLLLPGNYRLLLSVADHLLSWVPLRFDMRRIGEDTYQLPVERASGIMHCSDPRSARWMLKALQEDLNEYRRKSDSDPSVLVNKYHVPMFGAAVSIHDLARSRAIAQEINEDLIADRLLPDWLESNVYLNLKSNRLIDAMGFAERLQHQADRSGNNLLAARSWFLLGLVAEHAGKLAMAQDYYERSLSQNETLGNELGTAAVILQLGVLALERRELELAETWFLKSLNIFDRYRDHLHIAIACHNLGIIGRERRDFETAKQWVMKGLEMYERLGDSRGISTAYFALGSIAIARSDLEGAEKWIQEGIDIDDLRNDDLRSADVAFTMGELAELRHDYEAAAEWFRKSLGIQERIGEESSIAPPNLLRGRLAMLRGEFADAGRRIIRFLSEESVAENEKLRDGVLPLLPRIYQSSSEDDRTEIRKLWSDAHLERFGIHWEFAESSGK